MDELVASDLPTAISLLADVNSTLQDTISTVNNLIGKLKENSYNTDKGFSLLELKNESFMTYLMNLVYVTMRKVHGASIKDDPSINRLVEMRVSLERLRPMEDKLKYQVEKYAKIAKEGICKDDDPSRLSGDLENIAMSSDESDEEVDKKSKNNAEDKIYKIPKITQTHYPEEGTDVSTKNERERKRALNSTMLQDALYEYTDDPTVIHHTDALKEKAMRKRKEIERYEEETMTRINLSKKDRSELRQMSTMGNMKKELLSFRSLDALDPGAPAAKRSKPSGSKGKKKAKGKKGFKKRR